MEEYFIHLSILYLQYLLLAHGLNFSFGLGRLFNLAHVSAYALGAYTAALLSTSYGWGFFSCCAASIGVTALFSVLLGSISLRLRDDYFAIGSLAFHQLVVAVLMNWKELTGGVLGIAGIPRPEVGGVMLLQNLYFLVLSGIVTAAALVLAYGLQRSPFGLLLRAQAEDERAVSALGAPAVSHRTVSFLISSCLAGLAGSLFAFYFNYIDPSTFGLNELVLIITMVVLGGPGRYWTIFIGTGVLVALPELLRFSGELGIDWLQQPGVLGPMRQLLYGTILFICVAASRNSLFPVQRRV